MGFKSSVAVYLDVAKPPSVVVHVFASFDVICEAVNVSVREDGVANVSSPFFLCSQHYYATYSYCRSSNECVHYVVAKASTVQLLRNIGICHSLRASHCCQVRLETLKNV